MTEPDWDTIHNKKMAKGQRELSKRCFCGKLRVNHTGVQANICKGAMATDTLVRRITDKEAQYMEPRKI